jgi:serine/threonine protein kinase
MPTPADPSPGSNPIQPPADWAAPIRPGEPFGPYTLVRILGEGGFGIVYEGLRREPFVQSVAIKVLKPGMDSGEVLKRFEQERQALALMDHPGVAKVLDGGVTDANTRFGPGRPYFVMEYVAGEPITRFCAEHRLSLKARLGLFLKVCEAVQHAHQKGIIHRDLKPSNILVSLVDGVALPKVIDFGIAKALGGSITGRTLFTERGHMVGTPEYMSPEQADAKPDVDTRTDVYSLGVLLYELLTGELPFSARELRQAGFAEILRIIREVDPPTPSTRVAQRTTISRAKTGTSAGSTAAASAPDSAPSPAPAAQRDLKGDLDWIVMRALAKPRERRYESPASLSADIRRYLASEPVEAGPPSAAYRFSKFARRNRALVAGSTIALVAIVAGLVLSVVGLRVAQTQRDIAIGARASEQREKEAAQAARDQERKERLRAESALKLIRDSIENADPFHEQSALSFADLLQAMAQTLDREPPADRDQELAARALIGESFTRLGQSSVGAAQLERVRSMLPPDDRSPRWRRSTLTLAESYAALARPKEALALLDQVDASLTNPKDEAEEHDVYLSLLVRGESLRRMNDRAGSEAALRKALMAGEAICAQRTGAANCIDTAKACNQLAVLLAQIPGRQDEALALVNRALSIAQTVTGPESAWTETFYHNVGIVQRERGEIQAAIDAYTKALDLGKKRDTRPNIRTSGPRRLHAIAVALRDMNKLAEARVYAQKALDLREQLIGPSVETADTLSVLGGLAYDQGDYTNALRYFSREVAMLEDPKLTSDGAMSRALTGLANALLAEKNSTDAVVAADRALAIRQRIYQPNDWRIFSTMSSLGAAKLAAGDVAGARVTLQTAAEGIWDIPTIPSKRKRPIMERYLELLKAHGPEEMHKAWADRLRTMESSGSFP